MKRGLTFLFLCLMLVTFSVSAAPWCATCSDGSKVILSECNDTLVREKAVFKAAFTNAYHGTTIETMVQKKHGSLDHFLDVAFEDEENDFKDQKPDTLFVSAKNADGVVIGFVAFDLCKAIESKSSYVYVRQLAVHPEYQHKNLGFALTYAFLTKWSECRCVKLLTRKLNTSAVGFYMRLGFVESGYSHAGYDSSIYVGLEKVFNDDFALRILKLYMHEKSL